MLQLITVVQSEKQIFQHEELGKITQKYVKTQIKKNHRICALDSILFCFYFQDRICFVRKLLLSLTDIILSTIMLRFARIC